MFHRLTVPTYFGGLPVGADYLNTPSLSGGTGVPAFMDGKKTSGPNDGTYFFAFGEDATSNFFNRGLKALGENTDQLDDLLRRDLSMPARIADVLAVSPVSSVHIIGQVFVAAFGTANTQANRDAIFSIVDANDNEILDSNGTKVVVSWVHDGSNNNVLGTSATGFYASPTVNISPPVPAGTTYRIYYGERSNLADMPMDAFTMLRIRGAQEVSADVEQVLRSLHTSAAGATWNGPWVATINSLARTGLDGSYRLSTNDPGTTVPLNTPGSGSTILRDGPALTLYCPPLNWETTGGVAEHMPDPQLACFKLIDNYFTVSTTYDRARGGDVGLYQESAYHSTYDLMEGAYSRVSGPLLLDVAPRSVLASTLDGEPVLTRITAYAAATLNPDAGTSSAARCLVQLATGDFTRTGTGETALRTMDLIEVRDTLMRVIGTYRVSSIVSDNRVSLRSMSGSESPALGISGQSTQVHLRWLQPTLMAGGRSRDGGDPYNGWSHFMVAQPSPVTTAYTAMRALPNATFLSCLVDRTLNANPSCYTALEWGGFDLHGGWAANGSLHSDGGILVASGVQRLNLLGRNVKTFAIEEGGHTLDWDPMSGSHLELYTNGVDAMSCLLAISAVSGYTAQAGDEIDIVVTIAPGVVGPLVIQWPGRFRFSGADDIVPASNPGVDNLVVHYKLRRGQIVPYWFATRTDYIVPV